MLRRIKIRSFSRASLQITSGVWKAPVTDACVLSFVSKGEVRKGTATPPVITIQPLTVISTPACVAGLNGASRHEISETIGGLIESKQWCQEMAWLVWWSNWALNKWVNWRWIQDCGPVDRTGLPIQTNPDRSDS